MRSSNPEQKKSYRPSMMRSYCLGMIHIEMYYVSAEVKLCKKEEPERSLFPPLPIFLSITARREVRVPAQFNPCISAFVRGFQRALHRVESRDPCDIS
jgi:hypothetical protein